MIDNVYFVMISIGFSGLVIALLTLGISISFPRKGQRWFHVNQQTISPYRVLTTAMVIAIFAITISNDLHLELPKFSLPSIGMPNLSASTQHHQSVAETEESVVVNPPLPTQEQELAPDSSVTEQEAGTTEETPATPPATSSSNESGDGANEATADEEPPRGGRQGREPDWARNRGQDEEYGPIF